MNKLKGKLQQKISRLSERRRAVTEKAHPYISNRRVPKVEKSQLLDTNKSSDDINDLSNIQLQCNRSFTGIDISNTITSPSNMSVGKPLMENDEQAAMDVPEVDESVLLSPPGVDEIANASTSTPTTCVIESPDIDEESSIDSSMKRASSLRSSGRKYYKKETPILHVKRSCVLAGEPRRSQDVSITGVSLFGKPFEHCTGVADPAPPLFYPEIPAKAEDSLGSPSLQNSLVMDSEVEVNEVKDISTPVASTDQKKLKHSSLTTVMKKMASLRPSARKSAKGDTPRLPVKRSQSLVEPSGRVPCKRRTSFSMSRADHHTSTIRVVDATNALSSLPYGRESDKAEQSQENATSNGIIEKFRRRAVNSKLFSSMRGKNEKKVSVLESVTEAASPARASEGVPPAPQTDVSSGMAVEKGNTDIHVVDSLTTLDIAQFGTPENSNSSTCIMDILDIGVVSPPTPFKISVTGSDNSCSSGRSIEDISTMSSSRTISTDLKKEIEESLLHWPSVNKNKGDYSLNTLTRASRNNNTLRERTNPVSQSLTLPYKSNRPLSWSYDMTDSGEGSEETQAKRHVSTSQSDYTMATTDSASRVCRRSRSPRDSRSSQNTPTPASSCNTLSDNVIMDIDDGYDALANEEFGDAVTALRTFESKRPSYTRDNRRMSQPHPIKMRTRLTSKDSVRSLKLPRVQRSCRGRSKSEPPRLIHDDIRKSFHKELNRILMTQSFEVCPVAGDIAYPLSPDGTTQFTPSNITIADPLWHHVTNEAEELSFHVGDIIMVLDMSDKDWWWGRKTGSLNDVTFSEATEQETGWFPSTFVRLRANQEITADELLEDIKQGTLDTASVVQHYNSSLVSRDQARCNVLNEIITAERDYVKHLRDIVEGFVMKCSERSDMFSERQISVIFGNISAIYEVAQSFLDKLEIAVSQCESVHMALVGRCFLQHKRDFEIYSTYCNNHPRGLKELQELKKDSKYTHFFEACRLLQNMIELPLDGFLLTPIQKICKYPLQLAELLKYTHTDHGDYESLQEALGTMKNIAMLINERKRKLESIQRVMEWQSTVDDWQGDDILVCSSELIHSGELSKLSSAGRLVDRHFFLFDHQLIQCKKELLKKSLIYKSRISLDTHSVVAVEDGKVNNSSTYAKNVLELRDQNGTTVLVLSAKTSSDKEKWWKCFTKEREIVKQDEESGFAVTESFKALAELSVSPKTSTRPSKSNSLSRLGGGGKQSLHIIDNSKDKSTNNNKPGTKPKSSNGLIHKLKRARIVT